MATFFVVRQHFRAQCPTKRFRTRGWEKECNIHGENWATRWDPEQGGSRGKSGDLICKIADKELGGDIPNKEFPVGLQVILTNSLYISCISVFFRLELFTTSVESQTGLIQSLGGRRESAAR